MKKIYFFTDGASEPTNPGPSASAFCELSNYHDKRELYSESLFIGYTTNNVAELKAIDMVFDYLLSNDYKYLSMENTIYLYADSQYALDCIRKWYPEWIRKNKLKDKKNLELIKSIYGKYIQIKALCTIELEWVKAHNGHWGNERADELCVKQCLDNAGTTVIPKEILTPTEEFNQLLEQTHILYKVLNINTIKLTNLYKELVNNNSSVDQIILMIKEKTTI